MKIFNRGIKVNVKNEDAFVVNGVVIIDKDGKIYGDIHASAGSIGATELATDAVETVKIKDLNVTTGKLAAGAVTAAKLGANSVVLSKLNIVVKTVSVAIGQSSGSTANDPDCVGGQVLGYFPITNQDQFVTNVTLNVDGAILLGLLANATAQNDFNVVILKAA